MLIEESDAIFMVVTKGWLWGGQRENLRLQGGLTLRERSPTPKLCSWSSSYNPLQSCVLHGTRVS